MEFSLYCLCFLPFLPNVFCDFVINDTNAPFFLSEKDQIVQAYVGEKVQLQCQVANLNNSDVAVIWTKDTLENVIVSEREVIMDNGHISMPDDDYDSVNWNVDINNVEYSDAGEYFCQITTVPERLVQKMGLIVKTSPAIRIVPPGSFISIKIGDSLNLTCMSDQKLFSRIEWRKSGSILQALPEGSNLTSINYHINSVNLLDDGIYQCMAFINASLYEEVNVRVQVTYSPQILTKDCNLTFKEGESAMLSCNFTASPPALALWYRRGQLLPIPLTSDNRMKMVYGLLFDNTSNLYYGFNILHINNTNIDDCGIYVCNVTNSVGGSVVQVDFGGILL
uniref:Ig-like domain-containing protein n=1 Tax=Romanomermis culicivorax TaxID=13658 RepID=A0A915IEK0_ROMCU